MNDYHGEPKYLHVYDGADGKRWSVLSENRNRVASGLQGYSNLEDLQAITKQLFGAPVETKDVGTCGVGHQDCTVSLLQNRLSETEVK